MMIPGYKTCFHWVVGFCHDRNITLFHMIDNNISIVRTFTFVILYGRCFANIMD
jgi:hypothetical protein